MTPPVHLSHNKWRLKGKCMMCPLCSAEMDSDEQWYQHVRQLAIQAALTAKENLDI
jgi:hypothetical protein